LLVEILAAFSVGTVAFEGEVDAGLGFVVGGEVGFGTYFELGMCEGALIEMRNTL
jgi:hypothetical protein